MPQSVNASHRPDPCTVTHRVLSTSRLGPSKHLVVARTLLSKLGVFRIRRHRTCSIASEGLPSGCVLALATLSSPFLKLVITPRAFPSMRQGLQSYSLASPQDTTRTSNYSGQPHIHEMPSRFLLLSIHVGPGSRWVQDGLCKAILPT
jgi:hypothetical protein